MFWVSTYSSPIRRAESSSREQRKKMGRNAFLSFLACIKAMLVKEIWSIFRVDERHWVTVLTIYLGMKDEKECLYRHPIIQTFTPVGAREGRQRGRGWATSSAGSWQRMLASFPPQCSPIIHTPQGNQSDLWKHGFINVISILVGSLFNLEWNQNSSLWPTRP